MDWTVDILVLIFFGGLAAFGIASAPRNRSTAAEWSATIGLLGAIAWICWIFFRPGGEHARDVIQPFIDFFKKP